MLTLVLTWIGIAVATTLLLLMALGPAIVELDDRLGHRRRARKAATKAAPATRPVTQTKVVARPAAFN